MPISFRTGTFFAFLVVLGFAFFETGESNAQDRFQISAETLLNDPIFKPTIKKSALKLYVNSGKVIELPNKIATVYGYDENIVNISVIDGSPNKIRVLAEAEGVTTIAIADEHNDIYTIETIVQGDVTALQRMIKRYFPHVAIEAVAIKETVILRGWVMQPDQITQIMDFADQYFSNVINQMKVGGVQQVKLKVRVMEVQRSVVRRLGFNFLFADQSSGIASTPGSLTPVQSFTAPIGGQVAATVLGLADPTILLGLTGNSSAFQGFLEALKRESLLKILAEPELVTTNGHPANLLSGGEFPILVPQSLGTTTIEWREFGVRLSAVPIILGRGRVRLELEPEVSERDFTNSVNLGGILIPGITTRRVSTQVEMRFGETYMIAGLISTRTTSQTDKVPIVGELPWIGAAFRRLRFEKGETELVIMVTPELVGPLRPDQVLANGPGLHTDDPTDIELYGHGMQEVPSYGSRCEGCGLITPTSKSKKSQSQRPTLIDSKLPGSSNSDAQPNRSTTPKFPEISVPIPNPVPNLKKRPSQNPLPSFPEKKAPESPNSVKTDDHAASSRAGRIRLSSNSSSTSKNQQSRWNATGSRNSRSVKKAAFGKSPFGHTREGEKIPKTRWINQSRWRKTQSQKNKRRKMGLIEPSQSR